MASGDVEPTGKRIVVGVDGSAPSKAALLWAVRQAELTGADLEVVMTWRVPAASYGGPVPIASEIDLPGGVQRTLDTLISDVVGKGTTLEVASYAVEGPAAETLLREAKGADLLVVGNRGHGTLVGLMLGSVSEHCVTHATCPVVVVHET